MGETQIEVDKRLLRDRASALKKELESVRTHRRNYRQRRSETPVPVVALVGYTNAGKSTLLNTLTQAGVLAEDKLFATLDPTTRLDPCCFISPMTKLTHYLFDMALSLFDDTIDCTMQEGQAQGQQGAARIRYGGVHPKAPHGARRRLPGHPRGDQGRSSAHPCCRYLPSLCPSETCHVTPVMSPVTLHLPSLFPGSVVCRGEGPERSRDSKHTLDPGLEQGGSLS